MLTRLKEFLSYNKAVRNIDLDQLLSPHTLTKKQFPKRSKTYRTLSLARELRALHKDFWYFNDNTIVLEFLYGKGFKKKVVTILGNLHCYRVRVDVWTLTGGGNFYYKEFDYPTGASILFELVAIEVLDQTFLTHPSKYDMY